MPIDNIAYFLEVLVKRLSQYENPIKIPVRDLVLLDRGYADDRARISIHELMYEYIYEISYVPSHRERQAEQRREEYQREVENRVVRITARGRRCL